MLDTPAFEWRSRIMRHGPRLASIALAVLIAGELTRVSLALSVGNPVRSAPHAAGKQRQAVNHLGVDVGTILAAHLFGIAADGSAANGGDAPPTTANLVLTGTIATGNPKHGIAIIAEDGSSKVFAVGDAVGSVSLHSVFRDHVILERSGKLETLALPRLLPAGRRPDQSAAPAPAANPSSNDPHSLADVMRVGGSETLDGKFHGFRIYPGKNRSAFNRTGLRGGDLVIAVNGASVESQNRQTGQAIFDTIRTTNTATLTVERDRQPQDITVDVVQTEADASNDK